jgi:PIN domain nuclease of toxin-antitoxin system
MLNLDTHIVLHALTDRLAPRERAVLSREGWSMSAICLWEIVKLKQLRRIEIDLDDADVTRTLAKIHIWPITLAICRAVPTLDFKGDPADELIAATSIVEGARLVTRDRRIRRSRIVPLAL